MSVMRVAIQGEQASFHHTAAKQWFGEAVTIVPCDTFAEVFGTLNRHEAEAGIVAIENTLAGGINQVYDLIEAHGYPIIGEVHLPIHQQLIGTLDHEITHIYSHPVALAQCEAFLDSNYLDAERIEHHDTAGAVEFIKQSGNPSYAAIAGIEAAKLHNMPIIAPDIEDNPANFTRFLIVQPEGTPPHDADRTSLVLTSNHTPGALAKILAVFAEKNINLSKLQSRPIVGKPWNYRFYLVLDTAGDELHAALQEINPLTTSVTILGEYRHNPLV